MSAIEGQPQSPIDDYDRPLPRIVSRKLILAPEDLDEVAAAIQLAAPGTVFTEDKWPSGRAIPEIQPSERISDILTPFNGFRMISIEPGLGMENWAPDWEWSDVSGAWRNRAPVANPHGSMSETGRIRKYSPELKQGDFALEYIDEGEIYFRCRDDHPEDMKMARRIMRAIGKVVSNKNLGHTYAPDYPPLRPTEKGFPWWVGAKAREWALADQTRMFLLYKGPKPNTVAGVRPFP